MHDIYLNATKAVRSVIASQRRDDEFFKRLATFYQRYGGCLSYSLSGKVNARYLTEDSIRVLLKHFQHRIRERITRHGNKDRQTSRPW